MQEFYQPAQLLRKDINILNLKMLRFELILRQRTHSFIASDNKNKLKLQIDIKHWLAALIKYLTIGQFWATSWNKVMRNYFTCASVRSDLQVHSWQGWTRGHCPEQSRWRLSWCDSGRWGESWCTHWHCHCNSQPLVLKQIIFISTEIMFRSRTSTCVDITIQKRLYSNAACMAIILLSTNTK